MAPECPPPANETERLQALAWYDILDSVPEQAFDDLARLAAIVCDTPGAVISFIDRDRQWFKARIGVDAPWTARAISFCTHGIVSPRVVFEVPDTLVDPRFRDNPLVQEAPNVRFYAGAPLVTPEGFALGMLAVVDVQPRTLTAPQREALRLLARQVVMQLETRKGMAVLAGPATAEDGLDDRVGRVLDRLRALQDTLSQRET